MQYILTEKEYDSLMRYKEQYLSLVGEIEDVKKAACQEGIKMGQYSVAVKALRRVLGYNEHGYKMPIPEHYIFDPKDGHLYFDMNSVLRDFDRYIEEFSKVEEE